MYIYIYHIDCSSNSKWDIVFLCCQKLRSARDNKGLLEQYEAMMRTEWLPKGDFQRAIKMGHYTYNFNGTLCI